MTRVTIRGSIKQKKLMRPAVICESIYQLKIVDDEGDHHKVVMRGKEADEVWKQSKLNDVVQLCGVHNIETTTIFGSDPDSYIKLHPKANE